MAFELKKLNYPDDGLEPYIDAKTVQIHHGAHHKTYLDKFNDAIVGKEFEKWQLEKILSNLDLLPEDIRTTVKNNGGGYYNHNIYFDGLIPGGKAINDDLKILFDKYFGGFEKFKETFKNIALNTFGSGRACLAKDASGNLKAYSLSNQETALMRGDTPILMLDVWEHAYYLKHQNKRANYIDDFFQVVDWTKVFQLYKDYNPL